MAQAGSLRHTYAPIPIALGTHIWSKLFAIENIAILQYEVHSINYKCKFIIALCI